MDTIPQCRLQSLRKAVFSWFHLDKAFRTLGQPKNDEFGGAVRSPFEVQWQVLLEDHIFAKFVRKLSSLLVCWMKLWYIITSNSAAIVKITVCDDTIS